MKIQNIYYKDDYITVTLNEPSVESIVFEGGGTKGLVYVGAVQILEERKILQSIKNVGGTSSGAIISLAIGLGYNTEEIKKIVNNLKFSEFKDLGEIESKIFLSALYKTKKALGNLLFDSEEKGRGIFLGDKIQKWICEVIEKRIEELFANTSKKKKHIAFIDKIKKKKGSLTFRDLKEIQDKFPEFGIKDIFFTGTNLTDETLDIFSYYTTPDMSIDLAIRISTSIPWFFKSVKYNNKEYIDGDCLGNFPSTIFDNMLGKGFKKKIDNQDIDVYSTLIFNVDSQEEIKKIMQEGTKEDKTGNLERLRNRIKNKFLETITGINQHKLDTSHKKNIIQIYDLDYSTFNFNLKIEDIEKLEKSGYETTKKWFKINYDNFNVELKVKNIDSLVSYINKEELSCAKQRFFNSQDEAWWEGFKRCFKDKSSFIQNAQAY